MQVLAEGRWESSAGRIVTEGIGWKPSSEAGRAGEPGTRSRRIKIRQEGRILQSLSVDISSGNPNQIKVPQQNIQKYFVA